MFLRGGLEQKLSGICGAARDDDDVATVRLPLAVFLNDVPIGASGIESTFLTADRDLSSIAAAIQQNY